MRSNSMKQTAISVAVALWLVVSSSLESVDALAFRLPPRQKKLIATVVCGSTFLATSCVASAVNVAKGAKVFDNNCAQCHAGGQNLVAKERTLQIQDIDKYVGIENIQPFIQTSMTHRGALLLGSRNLSDRDFANVAAFVKQQAIEGKWPGAEAENPAASE